MLLVFESLELGRENGEGEGGEILRFARGGKFASWWYGASPR